MLYNFLESNQDIFFYGGLVCLFFGGLYYILKRVKYAKESPEREKYTGKLLYIIFVSTFFVFLGVVFQWSTSFPHGNTPSLSRVFSCSITPAIIFTFIMRTLTKMKDSI